MNLHAEIQICSDCIQMLTNGECGDNSNEIAVAQVECWGELTRHICAGDSDKDAGFSWSPCEGCGSKLGGDRYHAVVLCTHPGCSADKEET